MHGDTAQATGRDLQAGDMFAGHRIETVLGRGGMGVVYRATDTRLNRSVALKVIKPDLSHDDDFRRRFRRESEHAASIRQTNVVTIYQAGEADGRLYVTMDLIDGTDLRGLIRQRGQLDPATACEITAQIAAALDAAHARGLVHRDVKPANVLVANAAPLHVYLTDFGLTKRASSQSGITKTGLFVGTLDYAAPEQIQGWPVDARADVYALGCLLFELLTGQPPFRRENDYAILYAHMSEPAPAPSATAAGVPAAYDAVLARALAKDPDERHPSAGDLARAAQAAAEGHRPSQPERTVAIGPAAPTAPPVVEPATELAAISPTAAAAPPPAAPAPAAPAPSPAAVPPTATPPQYAAPPSQSRGPWPVIALIAAVLVAGAVAVAVVVTQGGDDPASETPRAQQQQAPAQSPASPPAVDAELRADALEIRQILRDSAEGRSLSASGDFAAAAANRREVLAQLDSMDPHADLIESHALLRDAIEASLDSNNLHAGCPGCADAQAADRRATRLKRRFVSEFNPIARDLLNRSYSADEI